MKHINVSLFVPHLGCPNSCIFCNQKTISGKCEPLREEDIIKAAEIAKNAAVGEMWLTHYSPSLNRPEEYMEKVRKIFPNAKAGKDSMSTELLFSED